MLLGQHATLAQSVERLTRNEQVDSSILSSGSGTARRWACRSCFYPVFACNGIRQASGNGLHHKMCVWRGGSVMSVPIIVFHKLVTLGEVLA